MIAALCTFLALLAVPTLEQDTQDWPKSPCPDVFMYEPPRSEPGRWDGVLNLSTDIALHSLWLDIVLDNKADILGNSVGEVSTTDNKDFKIENTVLKLIPGAATQVHFYVRYNALNATPRLVAIQLNGKKICNADTLQPVIDDRPDLSEPVTQPTQSINLYPKTVLLPPREPPKESPRSVNPRFDSNSNPANIPIDFSSQDLGRYISHQDLDRPGNGYVATTSQPNRWPARTSVSAPAPPSDDDYWDGPIVLSLPPSNPNSNTPNGQLVDNHYICGGTLVTHKHVITAAHCVTRKQSQQDSRVVQIDKNTLTVYLGKHNLRTSIIGVQIRFVEKITVHPDFSTTPFRRDVAILELFEPVSYSDWVRPACLWPDDQVDLRNVIQKKGSVIGWGHDGTSVTTEEPSLVKMPVVSQEVCIRSHNEFYVRLTSEYTYCAGYRDGTSVCNGDSGGGMVFMVNGIWHLRGLVSVSLGKRNEPHICDPTQFVIFTDLAKFLPWIYATVSDF